MLGLIRAEVHPTVKARGLWSRQTGAHWPARTGEPRDKAAVRVLAGHKDESMVGKE
jgi:hypothetical protein